MHFFKNLLFCCVFTLAAHAQIADLSKLSRGRLYSSDVIKDSKNSIRGYFLLFESDKVAKETYELEYVLLDENLNKVTGGFLTEMKYESWLIKATGIDISVSLYKNKLLLRLADQFEGVQAYTRFRTLDIKTNKLSDAFIFNEDSLKQNPVFDRKMSNVAANQSCPIWYLDGVGMIVYSYDADEGRKSKQSFVHYNDDMKRVWEYEFVEAGTKEKLRNSPSYLASDEDLIVFFNRKTKKNGAGVNQVSLVFLDSETGKARGGYEFPDLEKFTYRVADCKIAEDKVYVMGNYANFEKAGYVDDHEGLGLYSLTFDKATGKLEDKKFIAWADMGTMLPINKTGYVKKEGYMFVHNMLRQDDGKIVVVGETFENAPIITNNMYFFEFSPEFVPTQVFEVTKFRNKFSNTTAYSGDIKRYGLFDFIDYQDLGDGEYLFFLNDNEKKSKNRNKATLYGIVHYADGKFEKQTLNLKTETSIIRAMNAKKGYLMLHEYFDERGKAPELRLEKINY